MNRNRAEANGSTGFTITALATAYDAGLSPVDVVQDCLDRISACDGAIKAMIAVDAEGAMAAARQAETDLRSGRRLGPLHGVPVAVKDMIDVKGWPTTAGSRLFDGHLADQDAVCVANLKAAGAIIIGKTNLHELTVGGHVNPWFGKVVNPLDASRGTAGTSSGSAAAVAAGFCVAAVGTDTGGSNRSVAATTGLVGFKPTNGLLNVNGVRPTARSLDTIGPITSTVEDARLMTEAMLGHALARPESTPPKGLVVARCPGLCDADVDPVVAQSHAIWFDRLQQAGVRIVDLPIPDSAAFVEAGILILMYEFAQDYGDLIRQHPERVGSPARAFAEEALAVTDQTFAGSMAVRDQFAKAFLAQMSGVDLLAIPTAPGLAPRLSDECTQVGLKMVPFGPAGGSFRRWANMLRMPTLALPLPRSEGLPASIQLAAKPGQDGKLLVLAQSLGKLA